MEKEEVKNPCDHCETDKEEPVSWICEDCKA
jgi:hypothetical protein